MSSIEPKSFRAWVFQKAGTQLTLEERPLEAPSRGDVLIKVEACSICFTDADIGAGHFGDSVFPRVPGHEFIGHVAAVGSNVHSFKIGDRVGAGWIGGFDNTCLACKRGFTQICENRSIHGCTKDGGYAEYVSVQESTICKIPTDVSAAELAPMFCAGVTVFNGMRQIAISPDSETTVAVHGLGGLGHLAVQFAVKMGYKTIVISRGSSKEEMSKRLGASHYIDSEKENAVEALIKVGRVDMFVACGSDAGAESGFMAAMRPNGKVVMLAPFGDFRPSAYHLAPKCLTIRGWSCGTATDYKETMDFALEKGVSCMITPFQFEQAQEAFDHMRGGKARFRPVIVM